MTAHIVTAAGVVFLLVGLCAIAWWAHNDGKKKARVRIYGASTPIADGLAAALEQHLNSGGGLDTVIGYGVNAHPSGHHHVYLVTQADVVAGAESLLRETA